MTERWFKFHQAYLEDRVICADAQHLAVWCYLKANAAYQPTETVFGSRVLTLQAGQLVSGRRQISKATGISESTVQRILTHFAQAKRIRRQATGAGSLITIIDPQEETRQNRQQITRPDQPKPASGYRKRPAQKKQRVYSSDASYDLEEYAAGAIGLRD